MSKSLFSTLIAVFFCIAANAVPAKFAPYSIRLVDGSYVTVSLVGDEHCHYLSTLDGTPVKEVEPDVYRLAPELIDSLMTRRAERTKLANRSRMNRAKTRGQRREFGVSTPYLGKKKGIVILAEFPDLHFKLEDPLKEFNKLFNEKGYSKNDHIGSVHDYFYEQSYGKFDLTFDVVGPITSDYSYRYYGKNDHSGDDINVCELVTEACNKAHDIYGTDFSQYDWDGDGEVDQVFIIYASYGEHQGGGPDRIWAHEFSLKDAMENYNMGLGPFTLNNTLINTYAISSELCNSWGTKIDGIGTACHEFSHCLGLPDMYDVNYNGGFGMNSWDMLDRGSHNGPSWDGERPMGFTAYERNFAGWLDYTVLDKPCSVIDMPCLTDSPTAYVIYNDNNSNEFFILENRQPKGFLEYVERYNGIHGMLVYHVDYDKEAWEENFVNTDKNHQRMSIIPAGKKFGTYSYSSGTYSVSKETYASHLFPGSNNVTELTDDTHGAFNLRLFNPNVDNSFNLNKAITNIREHDGLISFDFMKNEETDIDATSNADSNTANKYFSINGTMMNGTPTKKGIYIMRTSKGETKKIIK